MKAGVFTTLFSSLLKLITLVEFLVGLGFLIFGCVLQTPPKAAVAVCACSSSRPFPCKVLQTLPLLSFRCSVTTA